MDEHIVDSSGPLPHPETSKIGWPDGCRTMRRGASQSLFFTEDYPTSIQSFIFNLPEERKNSAQSFPTVLTPLGEGELYAPHIPILSSTLSPGPHCPAPDSCSRPAGRRSSTGYTTGCTWEAMVGRWCIPGWYPWVYTRVVYLSCRTYPVVYLSPAVHTRVVYSTGV